MANYAGGVAFKSLLLLPWCVYQHCQQTFTRSKFHGICAHEMAKFIARSDNRANAEASRVNVKGQEKEKVLPQAEAALAQAECNVPRVRPWLPAWRLVL